MELPVLRCGRGSALVAKQTRPRRSRSRVSSLLVIAGDDLFAVYGINEKTFP